MTTTISNLVISCLQLYEDVFQGNRSSAFQEVPVCLWQDELGRLRLWAANIAAHQKGKSSLDYRLRNASHVREQVLKLLNQYYRLLQELESCFHGCRPEMTDLEHEFFDDEFDGGADQESETQNIYTNIVQVMNSLFQMSTVIRCPARYDMPNRATRQDTKHFEAYDKAHVRDKFPNADPAISARLGLAITRRRTELIYRKRHQKKLSQGLEHALAGVDEEHTDAVSSTEATEFQADRIRITDHVSESGLTQTSVAPSLFDPKNGVTIPNPPKASEHSAYFQCPYCYIMINITDSKDWARHLFTDILPYACVFPDCSAANKLFGLRREWAQHIKNQHISLAHATEPLGRCPLCNEITHQMTPTKLERHIGRHLEELSLFAIPRDDEDQEKSQEVLIDSDQARKSSVSSELSMTAGGREDHEEVEEPDSTESPTLLFNAGEVMGPQEQKRSDAEGEKIELPFEVSPRYHVHAKGECDLCDEYGEHVPEALRLDSISGRRNLENREEHPAQRRSLTSNELTAEALQRLTPHRSPSPKSSSEDATSTTATKGRSKSQPRQNHDISMTINSMNVTLPADQKISTSTRKDGNVSSSLGENPSSSRRSGHESAAEWMGRMLGTEDGAEARHRVIEEADLGLNERLRRLEVEDAKARADHLAEILDHEKREKDRDEKARAKHLTEILDHEKSENYRDEKARAEHLAEILDHKKREKDRDEKARAKHLTEILDHEKSEKYRDEKARAEHLAEILDHEKREKDRDEKARAKHLTEILDHEKSEKYRDEKARAEHLAEILDHEKREKYRDREAEILAREKRIRKEAELVAQRTPGRGSLYEADLLIRHAGHDATLRAQEDNRRQQSNNSPYERPKRR